MSFIKRESPLVRAARERQEQSDEIDYRKNAEARIREIASEPTYYPEEARKSFSQRVDDLREWLNRYQEINEYYNTYGMDRVSFRQADEYLPHYVFIRDRRNEIRVQSEELTFSYEAIFADKFLFNTYYSRILGGGRLSQCLAYISDGKIIYGDRQPAHAGQETTRVILKPALDDSGHGIVLLRYQNRRFYENDREIELVDYCRKFKNGIGILEKAIEQHPGMSRLNPYSVNTYRIVTVLDQRREVGVLGHALRLGTKSDAITDNAGSGGCGIGIHEDGTLMRYGFYYKNFGTKIERHPLTGILFEGYQVPYFNEAVDLVKRAHQAVPGQTVRSIGWDVAVTEDGPVIIEGNMDWGMPFLQMSFGPLKRRWQELFFGDSQKE